MDIISSKHFDGITVQCTKEIFLLYAKRENKSSWILDISAYGQWWTETFQSLDDAREYLVLRWNISPEDVASLVQSAIKI